MQGARHAPPGAMNKQTRAQDDEARRKRIAEANAGSSPGAKHGSAAPRERVAADAPAAPSKWRDVNPFPWWVGAIVFVFGALYALHPFLRVVWINTKAWVRQVGDAAMGWIIVLFAAAAGVGVAVLAYLVARFVARRFVAPKWAALIGAGVAVAVTGATVYLAPTGIITAIVLLLIDMARQPTKD